MLVLVSYFASPAYAAGAGFWSTSGGKIVDVRGNEVRMTGVNWGFEVYNQSLFGRLDGSKVANYKDILKAIHEFGFNTIRFYFIGDQLSPNCKFDNVGKHNPELVGLTCLEVMDRVIDEAGQLNIRIILDWHTSNHRWSSISTADWVMLAKRYKGNETVIGADLANEPHHLSACWGCGDGHDFRHWSESMGNAILSANPNWLIIVENILGDEDNSGKMISDPVRLSKPNKLVYSRHIYPWSATLIMQNNTKAWVDAGIPALVGEFATTRGQISWLDQLVSFMKNEGIAGTYWGWHYVDPKYSGESWYTESFINSDYLTVSGINNNGNKRLVKSFLVQLDPIGNKPPPPPPPPTTKKPGDANGDGGVNAADLQIWKNNFGLSGGVAKGNFNSDGVVDGLDYAIWFAGFGK